MPLASALKIAVDLKIFRFLQHKPLTLHAASLAIGAHVDFLRRILRLLAAYGFLNETASESYSLTTLSRGFVEDPSMSAAVIYMLEVLVPAHARLPEYCQSRGYRDPQSGDEVWKMVSGEDRTFYEWLHERPESAANFQTLLKGYSSDRPTWTSFYPTQDLLKTWQTDTPLFVDIGGGRGQDLMHLLNLHKTDIRSQLILQDLPEVIATAKEQDLDQRITPMAHDFFQIQPIKGARAYYLHLVLFNWPDEKALLILESLKPALTPGYSRILINDLICLPGVSHPSAPAMDIVMMSVFNGKVRSKAEWIELINKAGLKVERIWSVPAIGESVIEVGL